MRSLVKMKMLVSLSAFLLLAGGPFAKAESYISPGSPAPKLEIKTWVKGEPIKAFKPNEVYVVEFWAT